MNHIQKLLSMKIRKSIVIPICLFIYLMEMAYIGRHILYAGDYLQYFGIIAATIVVIVLLHFSLKKKERLREEREDDLKNKSEE